MNGPKLVCVGCGNETTIEENPVCAECAARMWRFGEELEDKSWNMDVVD